MCMQENWSVRTLEKNEGVEGEESPVALILCAEKSQETIERK